MDDTKTITKAVAAAMAKAPKAPPPASPKRPLLHAGTRTSLQAAESRRKQLELLEDSLANLAAQTKDGERKKRIAAKIARIGELKAKLVADMKVGGSPARLTEELTDQPFRPWRALTAKEKTLDLFGLNERYNRLEAKIGAELSETTEPEIERMADAVRMIFASGKQEGVKDIGFQSLGTVRQALQEVARRAYNFGRTMAASEMGKTRPPADPEDLKRLRATVDHLSDVFAQSLTNRAQSAAITALSVDAGPAAAAAHVRQALVTEATKQITHLASSVVGGFINDGRGDVFDTADEGQIISFTRSEVLDEVTCEMCLSLDMRTVAPDDPFVQLDLVHDNCRGFWYANYAGDEMVPDTAAIPKGIARQFDTVDGVPVQNAFKNLKVAKPVPENNGAVREANARAALRADKTAIKAQGTHYFRNAPIDQLVVGTGPQEGAGIWQYEPEGESRMKIDQIKDAMTKGAIIPPIQVVKVPGSDQYQIIDGHHRAAAAFELGRDTIPAFVRKQGVVDR